MGRIALTGSTHPTKPPSSTAVAGKASTSLCYFFGIYTGRFRLLVCKRMNQIWEYLHDLVPVSKLRESLSHMSLSFCTGKAKLNGTQPQTEITIGNSSEPAKQNQPTRGCSSLSGNTIHQQRRNPSSFPEKRRRRREENIEKTGEKAENERHGANVSAHSPEQRPPLGADGPLPVGRAGAHKTGLQTGQPAAVRRRLRHIRPGSRPRSRMHAHCIASGDRTRQLTGKRDAEVGSRPGHPRPEQNHRHRPPRGRNSVSSNGRSLISCPLS